MAATARLRREEAAQCAGKASQRRGAWLRIRRRRCRIRPFRGWIRPVTTGSGRSLVGGDGRPRDQWDDIVQDMIVIGNGPGRLDYWFRRSSTMLKREAHSDVELNDFQDKMEVELQGCHALQ
uniref:Expressed protein n=1 Tax=Oryza sativa subsp. japonica TaxID=39947 RepID=Q33AM0_ORYSJ|nr:expressed protein [Oryza sativa Japonica Group]